MNPQLTIVTAASSNHFLPLQSLLWTISKFEPSAHVFVYDLGLSVDEHAETIHSLLPLTNSKIRSFDFTKYPPHFSLVENAGRMAFRPTVLAEIAHELSAAGQTSSLLWLDAGCQLREPLATIKAIIRQQSVYSPCAPGSIANCLYPAAHSSLSVTSDLLLLAIRDAGICGFDITNPAVVALLDRWAAVALDKNCTAPGGSTRHTHRQDAVFAVLLNQSAKLNNWCLEGKRLHGLAIKQDHLTLAETKFRVEGPPRLARHFSTH
jgi:hypothetical protein